MRSDTRFEVARQSRLDLGLEMSPHHSADDDAGDRRKHRRHERGESDALLDYLFSHCNQAEFQCRLRWRENTVAFWDNRCTMHKVIDDYWPEMREMHRIAIEADERPAGIQ